MLGQRPPDVFRPDFDSIPEQLTRLNRWVLWRWDNGRGKWAKVPCVAESRFRGSPVHFDPRNARSDTPADWRSFTTAHRSYESILDKCGADAIAGVGFVLGEGVAGFDLDDCYTDGFNGGQLSPWAEAVVNRLDTYTELSSSGTGVKGLLFGSKPGDRTKAKGLGLELHDGTRPRYYTITGRPLASSPATLNDRGEALAELYRETFGDEPANVIPAAAPFADESDAKTLRRGRAYLSTLPPSIEGQNGSAAMYYAARALVHGFCLSEADAMPLLIEYNARAEPPWSVRELEHKLTHAAERPFGKPRGWLLQGGAA